MARDSEKIRLPELPVFKKYSLALRQEFASVEEILAVLDRTTAKIRDAVDRADEERRRQEMAQAAYAEEVDASMDDDDTDLRAELPEISDDPDQERPFWEEPGAETSGEEAATPEPRKPPSKSPRRPKPKKKARPAIVHVGDLGKPIGASKQTAEKRKTSTKQGSKGAQRKPETKRREVKRSTAVSQRPKKKVTSGSGPKSRPSARKR